MKSQGKIILNFNNLLFYFATKQYKGANNGQAN